MTDNDRELIELAAKAYGIQVKGWLNDKLIGFDTNTERPVNGDWNPLESDGDAFRLMAALNLRLYFGEEFDMGVVVADKTDENWEFVESHSISGNGKLSAARRAIVEAAAETGRGCDE